MSDSSFDREEMRLKMKNEKHLSTLGNPFRKPTLVLLGITVALSLVIVSQTVYILRLQETVIKYKSALTGAPHASRYAVYKRADQLVTDFVAPDFPPRKIFKYYLYVLFRGSDTQSKLRQYNFAVAFLCTLPNTTYIVPLSISRRTTYAVMLMPLVSKAAVAKIVDRSTKMRRKDAAINLINAYDYLFAEKMSRHFGGLSGKIAIIGFTNPIDPNNLPEKAWVAPGMKDVPDELIEDYLVRLKKSIEGRLDTTSSVARNFEYLRKVFRKVGRLVLGSAKAANVTPDSLCLR